MRASRARLRVDEHLAPTLRRGVKENGQQVIAVASPVVFRAIDAVHDGVNVCQSVAALVRNERGGFTTEYCPGILSDAQVKTM